MITTIVRDSYIFEIKDHLKAEQIHFINCTFYPDIGKLVKHNPNWTHESCTFMKEESRMEQNTKYGSEICPCCHKFRALNKDGRFRRHPKWRCIDKRRITNMVWCEGSYQKPNHLLESE